MISLEQLEQMFTHIADGHSPASLHRRNAEPEGDRLWRMAFEKGEAGVF